MSKIKDILDSYFYGFVEAGLSERQIKEVLGGAECDLIEYFDSIIGEETPLYEKVEGGWAQVKMDDEDFCEEQAKNQLRADLKKRIRSEG